MVYVSLAENQHTTDKFTGDLVHVNVLGRSMVYVNSSDIARDLFERRSSVYADRPELPMLTLFVPSVSFSKSCA
jgi:hypothetical protein